LWGGPILVIKLRTGAPVKKREERRGFRKFTERIRK